MQLRTREFDRLQTPPSREDAAEAWEPAELEAHTQLGKSSRVGEGSSVAASLVFGRHERKKFLGLALGTVNGAHTIGHVKVETSATLRPLCLTPALLR